MLGLLNRDFVSTIIPQWPVETHNSLPTLMNEQI